MIAASVTSAARRPTPSARRRSPTPARAPASTTIEYEWLPRLTETIMAPRRGARSRRGAANDGSLPGRCRSRDRCGGGVPPEDRRGDEHDQLGGVVAVTSLLEQPAEDRDVAEERDAADRLLALAVRHAADHQPLAFLDEHLGLRLALVDGGRLAAAGAEVDGGAPRVVLDQHAHLDAIDVPLADDGRRDLELEHRLLELDLGAGRAHRRVRDFLAERDGGLVVLDGHDLRPGQRAGLALALQRFQREVEVQAAADDAERDPGGASRYDAGEDRADRQVHEVAAVRQAGRGADRQDLAGPPSDGQVRIRQFAAEIAGPDAAGRECVADGAREAPADEHGLVVVRHAAAAPLDAQREEIVARQDLHARLDLHLWQRDVELLADQRLDPLEVGRVVADEQRVRRLVGRDRDGLGQHVGRG